jgi:hypothetical protein
MQVDLLVVKEGVPRTAGAFHVNKYGLQLVVSAETVQRTQHYLLAS